MLFLAFLLASFALFLQSILSPKIGVLAFAPFLSIAILRSSFTKALYLSAFTGGLLDLLSNDPMGLHALNYCLVTAFTFRVRKHLSYEQPLHLSLFTGLLSFLSTLLQLVLLFLFDKKIPFKGGFVLIDLFAMPILDILYAFVWFAAPLVLFEKLYNKTKQLWIRF
jgi:rod shape-determining protein MreD